MNIGYFIIIGFSIVLFFLLCHLLYLHIIRKKIEKAISELEGEQERMKFLKESFMELKDIFDKDYE
ncbi:MAG: hypothetical protein IKU15_05915 [Clostridia bacterium]|nr:hypothetical protein [Clostridia bacterium]